ncbi:hypothetical protein SAMN05444409_2210 [Epilithonimonas zeae]|uniref:Uncharacterized protein n=1 Tax=Epilithonimonas zeae TaxID=1416779 RepID=A0A1N6H2H8_9FLAO|nr:hypothetical protein SAMN05444409_2210 [Epilithonimonas zeae]
MQITQIFKYCHLKNLLNQRENNLNKFRHIVDFLKLEFVQTLKNIGFVKVFKK